MQALWDVNADAARKMLDQATSNTRSGLTEARRALHALRAKPLEDVGLVLALTLVGVSSGLPLTTTCSPARACDKSAMATGFSISR